MLGICARNPMQTRPKIPTCNINKNGLCLTNSLSKSLCVSCQFAKCLKRIRSSNFQNRQLWEAKFQSSDLRVQLKEAKVFTLYKMTSMTTSWIGITGLKNSVESKIFWKDAASLVTITNFHGIYVFGANFKKLLRVLKNTWQQRKVFKTCKCHVIVTFTRFFHPCTHLARLQIVFFSHLFRRK